MFPGAKFTLTKNTESKTAEGFFRHDLDISTLDVQPTEYGWTDVQTSSEERIPPTKQEANLRGNNVSIARESAQNNMKKALVSNEYDVYNSVSQDEWDSQFTQRTRLNENMVDVFTDERSIPVSDRHVMQQQNKNLLNMAVGANSYASRLK